MKIRSLLLGSVAAAGLSTGAYAADAPTIFAALNICDALGLSGLTIASDTNCLQISGAVNYTFEWGSYTPGWVVVSTPKGDADIPAHGLHPDWNSKLESWIKFVATADSDFGPAKAVIKLKDIQQTTVADSWPAGGAVVGSGSDTGGVVVDEGYVAIGDSTVIMAGKKGSIINKGDDAPLNHTGLFLSNKVDTGVDWSSDIIGDGGHVIQVTSDLGNGVSASFGLENLNSTDPVLAGTAVGVLAYAGDGISAHVTMAAAGILDGVVENWGIHAGFSGTFDMVKFVAAIAGDSTGYWNGLASASVGIDMFTLAASVEGASDGVNQDIGAGGSISAGVTDTVTINLGGKWYQARIADNADAFHAEAQIVAAVTESITATGAVGLWNRSAAGVAPDPHESVYYGSAELAWAPGGGFTSSVKGEYFSNHAYRITTKFGKTFE